MKSSVDVCIPALLEVMAMLDLLGITVIGSKEAEGVVCLAIEGDTLPDAPKVVINVGRESQLIDLGGGVMAIVCRPVADAQQVE